jgi:hypothetical protein
LANLGDKYGQESPWYEWVLASPALLIAVVIGFISSPAESIKYYTMDYKDFLEEMRNKK